MQNRKKIVLVTGSTSGIGFHIAKLFYEKKFQVVINGKNKKKLNKIKKQMPECFPVLGDMTNYQDTNKIIKLIVKHLGGLDLLICNVGSGKSTAPGKENVNEFRKMLEINLFSSINIIENALPHLTKSKGSIICISSICGLESIPGAPITYSVAKSALNSFVKFMSKSLALRNIRINAIAPGNILFKGSTWEKKLRTNKSSVMNLIKKEVSLGRFGKTEDVANLALYLSGKNAEFITGSIFIIDGGQTKTL